MNRILTVICALALVVAFTATAQAEVQNVKVSGDITTYGIWRDDYDLDSSSDSDKDDAWYQTTTRLRIDADLTDNVSATIRLINERDWGVAENNSNTDIDLDLAYVTLKEMLYSPLTVTIGRQEISDLTDLVVGDPYSNDSEGSVGAISADDLSARKSFDAIRADLDYSPWVITLLAAKIEDNTVVSGTANGDDDLYGLNVAYDFDQYNANAEGYVFVAKKNDLKDQEIYTIGLKGAVDPIANLTLSGEIATQTGDYSDSQDADAWALDLNGNYVWANNQYTPQLGLGYIYRSGDTDTNDGDYEAWNTLYENQTHGVVANYLFGGINEGADSNCHIITASGSIVPVESVKLALNYYHYILDEELVSSNGDSKTFDNIGAKTMNKDDDFGDEIDLTVTYDYTEDVQFGLTYGIFMPGNAFDSSKNDDASELLGSVKVTF